MNEVRKSKIYGNFVQVGVVTGSALPERLASLS